MNRRIAMSLLSVVGALTLMGGSAFAAFPTTATANNSTFSSANPQLEISQDNGSDVPVNFTSNIPGFSLTGLVPGVPQTFKFWLKNNGSTSDGTLSLTSMFTGVTGSPSLETDLHVSLSCLGVGNVADMTFNNYEGGQAIVGGSGLAPQADSECTMTVTLPSGNTTDANQNLIFNAVFGGSVGL